MDLVGQEVEIVIQIMVLDVLNGAVNHLKKVDVDLEEEDMDIG